MATLTKNFGIAIKDLDENTIHWLDNSKLNTHRLYYDKKPIVSNLLKQYPESVGLKYLIWDSITQNFGLTSLNHESLRIGNLKEFQKAIGMKAEESVRWRQITFEEAREIDHGTELRITLKRKNNKFSFIGFRCKEFNLTTQGEVDEVDEGGDHYFLVGLKSGIYSNEIGWESSHNAHKFPFGYFVCRSSVVEILIKESRIDNKSGLETQNYLQEGRLKSKVTIKDHNHNLNFSEDDGRIGSIEPPISDTFKRKVSLGSKIEDVFDGIPLGDPQACLLTGFDLEYVKTMKYDWDESIRKLSLQLSKDSKEDQLGSDLFKHLVTNLNNKKRSEKNMFTKNTKVKDIVLHDIHKVVFTDVAYEIAKAMGGDLRSERVDDIDKFYIVLPGSEPLEITPESAKQMLIEKVKDKNWNDVNESKSVFIIAKVGLLKSITLENEKIDLKDKL